MSVEDFVGKMQRIQNVLLEFLENESDAKDKYSDFIKTITNEKIIEDKHKFKLLLRLLNNIGNNHHRVHNFINKIELLLKSFKKDIENYFSNAEIFELFGNNKRIFLFLIEEKMIIVDEHILYQNMGNNNYIEYFAPEIKPFIDGEFFTKYCKEHPRFDKESFIEKVTKEISTDFYDKRREGENDDYLCRLIRLGKVEEFISFVEQSNISLEINTPKSIFETNEVLYTFHPKLIEYAAFHGSNDIIKYMQMKGVELTSDIWIHAIHSQNAELIQILEDNRIPPPFEHVEGILCESIKCHHKEISNYILEYLIKKENLQNNIDKKYDVNLYRHAFEFDNYSFFPENIKYKNMFFYLCEFDYYSLVKLYLEEENIDINAKSIIQIY